VGPARELLVAAEIFEPGSPALFRIDDAEIQHRITVTETLSLRNHVPDCGHVVPIVAQIHLPPSAHAAPPRGPAGVGRAPGPPVKRPEREP